VYSSFKTPKPPLEQIRLELTEARTVLDQFLAEDTNLKNILSAANLMRESIQSGGKLMSCGNGGSMCDAMHFAEELTGRFRNNRPALPAIAISDASHLTCVGNDYGYEYGFARYVEALGREGDVLLAISTSGNSANVLMAAEAAKARGMQVVALTGKEGGKLANLCDIEIRVAHHGFADRIQEVHIKVIHILIMLIEKQ
jgi:D-sedoheptulose 7-phosphate isomerase